MAKIVSSTHKISGKVGDVVHVQTRDGSYVRTAPKKGSKKNEPALKRGYRRTGLLNSIAGAINDVLKAYDKSFKPARFYDRAQSLLRKEPGNHRLLLLSELKGMEIHTTYKLNRLNPAPQVSAKAGKNKIIVKLTVDHHPHFSKSKGNCYCFDVLLLTWNKNNKLHVHKIQKTNWIYPEIGLPIYEFVFSKPVNTMDYLVIISEFLGKDDRVIEDFLSQGMIIAAVGTFDTARQKLLDKKRKDKEKERLKENSKREEVVEERVEPKMVRKNQE